MAGLVNARILGHRLGGSLFVSVKRGLHQAAMGYYIHTRPGILRPAVGHFINWLRQETRQTAKV